MPQKNKGPRLWLEPSRPGSNRRAAWVIRDGGIKRSTGYRENQRQLAELALQNYLGAKPNLSANQDRLPCYLYFISARHPGFPIKIGITTARKDRFSVLQTSLPYEIEVLAMVEVEDPLAERKMHRALAEYRLRGEWFAHCAPVLDAIRSICATASRNCGNAACCYREYETPERLAMIERANKRLTERAMRRRTQERAAEVLCV